jgi:prevent-host-death family protein
MHAMPQLIPVSELRYNHKKVFDRLKAGAILLAQRSQPAAVLVSVQQWDELAQLVKDLQAQLGTERRLRLSNQRYAEALADPSQLVSQEEYERMLAEAGLVA